MKIRRLNLEEKEKIRDSYAKFEKSKERLASEWGVSPQTIRKILEEVGINRNKKMPKEVKEKRYCLNCKELIKYDITKGHKNYDMRKFCSVECRNNSPETIARMKNCTRGRKHTEEAKEKIRSVRLGKTNIEIYGEERAKEVKERLSKARLGRTWDEIFGENRARIRRENRRKNFSGENNPFYGKKHTEEEIIKMKNSHIGKCSGENNSFYGRHHSEEYKQKSKERSLAMWTNPDSAKELSRKILAGLMKRPTSFEKKIIDLCIECNLPFLYTGDGRIIIGRRNPDFINEKDKIIIEVYYKYFKINSFGSCENYEKQRSEYFAKYGYKVIFFSETELLDKNWKSICLNKLTGNLKIS